MKITQSADQGLCVVLVSLLGLPNSDTKQRPPSLFLYRLTSAHPAPRVSLMTHTHYNPLDVLDDEIPYPEWMEADLYGDDEDRDYYEESYNGPLMDGYDG